MKKIIILVAIVLLSVNVLKADFGPFGRPVTTTSVTNIAITTATVNSAINLLSGDPQVSQKGVVWSTTADPTIESHSTDGGYTSQGTGCGVGCSETFTSSLTGLKETTLYYVTTYAVISGDTYYSDQVTFTTIPVMPVWGLIVLASVTLLIGGFYVRKILV